ncbi:ABC transporter permease subunit [bacterium]|nr:ABC transporter permease subunit [bacterium]
MKKTKGKIQLIVIYFFLIIFTLATLYPVMRVISISLRPGDRLLSTSLALIPEGATLDAYKKLFSDDRFLRWMLNSILVSTAVTLIGVILASMSGFIFSKYDFIGKKAGMTALLTTQMFPATMLLLPMYIMISKLGLINSFVGLIVIYSATALPFCIWQMKGYYDTIPNALYEAAVIDGCSNFQAFIKVILPLAAPALVITALFSFMASWSEYIVAAQVLQSQDMFTLPLGLKQFQSNMTTEWGLYAAGSVIVSIPVVVLFIILSRWLVSGLTLGSVKE